MTIPDNVARLIEEGDLPVLIVGNPALFDYEIVPLDDGLDGRTWRPRSGRPCDVLGAIAIVDGVGRCQLAVPTLEAQATRFIASMYAAHVKRSNNHEAEPDNVPVTDDAAWLDRYYKRLYRG
jgi:hypothetical protein